MVTGGYSPPAELKVLNRRACLVSIGLIRTTCKKNCKNDKCKDRCDKDYKQNEAYCEKKL